MIRAGDIRDQAEGQEVLQGRTGRAGTAAQAPGAHLARFATPDRSIAICTSSRVTWGGGECLDDAGELVTSCPRHAPARYALLDARHRQLTPARQALDDLANAAVLADWRADWCQRVLVAAFLGRRQRALL